MHSGAFRKITREEYLRLEGAGERVDWAEGCGYIAYDAQAQREFEAARDTVKVSTRGTGLTK